MKLKPIFRSFLIFLFTASLVAEESHSYPFTYAQIRALPEFSAPIFEWPPAERIVWLNEQIAKTQDPAEAYHFHRYLTGTTLYLEQKSDAFALCQKMPPLAEDIYYRFWCIEAETLSDIERLEKLIELSLDAEKFNRPEIAVNLLSQIGWKQSQMGDISAAFATYEKALAIAPKDDLEVTSSAMFDVASLYIVHGDEALVLKGIGLLQNVRQEFADAAAKAAAANNLDESNILLQQQLLADFNTGIAYVLHLYDYPKALEIFDRVIKEQKDFEIEAASFAAIAAAELRQYEKVQQYIERIGERKNPEAVVQGYLHCYQQLAQRHSNLQQPIDACYQLHEATTTEVTIDVFKRISAMTGSSDEINGLRSLRDIYIQKIEPELKKRSSIAASNTELKRLETESNLKSEILQKEQALKQAIEGEKDRQYQLFMAIALAFALVILIIVLQLRQKKKLAVQFEQMSLKDGLTDLGNRRFFEHNIIRELAYIKRHHKFDHTSMLGIYIFDLDHFKKINDLYGHDSGDAVLVEFSRRLKNAIRETDLLIRWGGEEFVFVARVKNEQEIYDLAERLRGLIKDVEFELPTGKSLTVTCTIGAVKFPFFEDETLLVPWQQLISLADMALYYGKEKRDAWVVVGANQLDSPDEIAECLENSLQDSIDKRKLSVTCSF